MIHLLKEAQNAKQLIWFDVNIRPDGTDIMPGTKLACIPMDEESRYFTTDDKPTVFVFWNGANSMVKKIPVDKRYLIKELNKHNRVYVTIACLETSKISDERLKLYKEHPELMPQEYNRSKNKYITQLDSGCHCAIDGDYCGSPACTNLPEVS